MSSRITWRVGLLVVALGVALLGAPVPGPLVARAEAAPKSKATDRRALRHKEHRLMRDERHEMREVHREKRQVAHIKRELHHRRK
jgi:hypothetical protein